MKQKGDTIELPGSGHHMQYYIDFHQEIYVQNDRNKHCKTYPYGNFETYNNCDKQFIRKTLDDPGMTNLTPVWATDNMEEVNYLADNHIPFVPMDEMFTGVEPNECPKPCTTTTSYVKFLSDTDANYTSIALIFSKEITINKTDMVKFNFLATLSFLGSNMGLWLGLGAVQFLEIVGNQFVKT